MQGLRTFEAARTSQLDAEFAEWRSRMAEDPSFRVVSVTLSALPSAPWNDAKIFLAALYERNP